MSRSALARKIIEEIIYITLATSDKQNRPWCTPVFAAYNKRYEFYWASGYETRHSQNIRDNPQTSVVIYNSIAAEGDGEGVYIEGTAQELKPESWQEGLRLLRARSKFADKFFPLDEYQVFGAVRLYRFIPAKFFMLNPNGDSRYKAYADCREEIDPFSI